MAVSPQTDMHDFAPNEYPEWTVPDDAEHWIRVYSELIRFLEPVLARTSNTQADRDRILRRLRHYGARLAFWSLAQQDVGWVRRSR